MLEHPLTAVLVPASPERSKAIHPSGIPITSHHYHALLSKWGQDFQCHTPSLSCITIEMGSGLSMPHPIIIMHYYGNGSGLSMPHPIIIMHYYGNGSGLSMPHPIIIMHYYGNGIRTFNATSHHYHALLWKWIRTFNATSFCFNACIKLSISDSLFFDACSKVAICDCSCACCEPRQIIVQTKGHTLCY